ncbi:hypothetical protein [Amorphus sp. MBR-141]
MAFITDTAPIADTRSATTPRTEASFFEILRAARRLSVAADQGDALPQDAIEVVMGKRAYLRR